MAGDYRIKAEDILKATNDGLDIIIDVYPEAQKAVDKPGTKFKIRDEGTASTSLSPPGKTAKGDWRAAWVVTDFGDDSKPLDGIGCYAKENNLEYFEALKQLAAKYGVSGEEFVPVVHKAAYSGRDATDDEPDGQWTFEERNSFTDFEIETVLPKNALYSIGWKQGEEKHKYAYSLIAKKFKTYNFRSVLSYTIITERKAHTYSATDQYPMFLFREKSKDGKNDFYKLYQPNHEDKGRRFMYHGTKEKNFIHGIEQARAMYAANEAANVQVTADAIDSAAVTNSLDKTPPPAPEKRKPVELPELVLCSGGSDALTLAILGYHVCWMNSETAKLDGWQFKEMTKLASKVYQCPDIDDTGKKAAHALALEYLDLYTIVLPEALKEKRDRRGKPCKDLRDYLNHFTVKELKVEIGEAIPYAFWEMTARWTGKGDDKVWAGWKYGLRLLRTYNFLNACGFYRLPVEARKTDYIFIQKVGNVVKEVTPNNVKTFLQDFAEERRMDHDLREMLYETTQLNETSLSNLKQTTIDFKNYGKHSQYVFFKNGTWEITKEGITHIKAGSGDRYVWEQDVIDRNVKVLDTPFTITEDPAGGYDIVIHHNKCLFLNYLINVSRIHWRKELEVNILNLPTQEEQDQYRADNQFNIAGELLEDYEVWEQKQHLVNKIFSVGYGMHQYKNESKPWITVAMDNKYSSDGRSYGGTGKSILFGRALPQINKTVFKIPGTNPKKTEDPHIFHGMNKNHSMAIIDDADKGLQFRFFFEFATTDVVVNPKNNAPYTIDFADVPKLYWLTNFAFIVDPSMERRILYTVFSDFYHSKNIADGYPTGFSPEDQFGKNLFTDFSPEEYNLFYNTMARCCQFYLGTSKKIEPPMDNVTKRNLQREMGEEFENWAKDYFSPDNANTDRFIIRKEAYEDWIDGRDKKSNTETQFKRKVDAFCRFNKYLFNPTELINDKTNGRITHHVKIRSRQKDGSYSDTGRKGSMEVFYIQTDFEKPLNTAYMPGDELPF